LAACFTNAIGIHPIVGAFLMGIILPRNVLFTGLIDSIDLINAVLFLPLFFVYSGLRTRVGLIGTPWRWLKCLLVLTVACRGKIFGGMSAMRLLKESWRDALSLGALMNTRGLVELIVLTIGLDLHVRSTSLFAMLVIMALVTTMVASPLLPLPGYRQRTAQEAQEKIGFLVESQA